MANKLNSALMPVAISREDNSTLGVPSKDFTATDTAFFFEQDLATPLSATDNVEKTVKKSTRGRNIQSQKDVLRGNDLCTLNFSNNVSKNDFATLFMPLFFQHGYAYTPTVTDSTITAVSSVTDTVTITVTDIGTLIDGDYVVISGRTITAENDIYEVSNISSNSFDITFTGGFDTAIEGVADAELNTHTSVFEDVTDCNKRRIESSFTFYQPYAWDKADCAVGEGEIITGLAPKTGNINFVDSTYTIDMVGRETINDSNNLPVDSDYRKPINATGTYFNTNNPVIKDEAGVVQDCLALEMTVTLNPDETQKAYKANKYDKVIVDGETMINGSYSLLFETEDQADNHSATLYANRKNTENSGKYSVGLSSNDGSYFEITGEMNFQNEVKEKVANGWELSMDYEFLYDESDLENITVTCVNGINQSIAELFSSIA